tara:strand:- start:1348 stop:2046 length:699 start_codon:yes stop_codon:yes gene_type:complete
MSIRHKTIVSPVNLQSHTVHSYLESEGERLISSYSRIGSLLLLTSSELELNAKITAWQSELLNLLTSEAVKLSIQKKKYTEELPNYKELEVLTPDTFVFDVSISHPCLWALIDAIKKIDSEANEIENLWLAGFIDDEARYICRNRIVNILRSFNSRIERATSPGKNRNGGRFTSVQLIQMLRGGLELYVDDNAITQEIARYKQQAQDEVNTSDGSQSEPVLAQHLITDKQSA